VGCSQLACSDARVGGLTAAFSVCGHPFSASVKDKPTLQETHHVDGAMQVDGGRHLGVHGDDVRTGLGEVGDAQLGLHDHLVGRQGIQRRRSGDATVRPRPNER
jgi:hypothetical protein